MENKKNPDKLQALSEAEKISSLDIEEPELKAFDAAEIFEFKEQPQKKSLFGKRSQKAATVRIKNPEASEAAAEPQVFSEHPDVAPAVTELKNASPAEPEEAEQTREIKEPIGLRQSKKPVESVQPEPETEAEDEDENEYYQDDEVELYEDKKRFLLSQYPMIEDYLAEQSADGYHYVRHLGRKYYFSKGEPENYYYSICYFRTEPDKKQWRTWEKDGWQLVSRDGSKKKKEAGWFVFRHPEEEGEYRKSIDNEAEKYRFFRKYANSCRSTMFLIFICMVLLLITAFLQWQFNGYLWTIIVCLVLFLAALIVFLQYNRMLRFAKKRARMLQAKLRVLQAQRNRIADEMEGDPSETEADLERDWNTLG